MPKVFISYRRADTAGYAGRLHDYLSAYLGENSLFIDIDSIPPGEDFVRVIQRTLDQCDVVLALIGPHWLARETTGWRRIDDSNDFVRLELATAITDPSVRVIPVLVNDARMPDPRELPPDLQALTRRNAIELSNERFGYDVERLVTAITGKPAPEIDLAPSGTRPRPRRRPRTRAWMGPMFLLGLWCLAALYLDTERINNGDSVNFTPWTWLAVIPLTMAALAVFWPARPRAAITWAILAHGGFSAVFTFFLVNVDDQTFGSSDYTIMAGVVVAVVIVIAVISTVRWRWLRQR